LVLGDRAKYDAIWAGVLADASESEHIGALTAAVALVRSATPGVARHVNRRRGAEEGAFGCGDAGTLDESAPVTSLDQLYFQVNDATFQLSQLNFLAWRSDQPEALGQKTQLMYGKAPMRGPV
jgi:hypothetical protein